MPHLILFYASPPPSIPLRWRCLDLFPTEKDNEATQTKEVTEIEFRIAENPSLSPTAFTPYFLAMCKPHAWTVYNSFQKQVFDVSYMPNLIVSCAFCQNDPSIYCVEATTRLSNQFLRWLDPHLLHLLTITAPAQQYDFTLQVYVCKEHRTQMLTEEDYLRLLKGTGRTE
jgi:hypothetical protein